VVETGGTDSCPVYSSGSLPTVQKERSVITASIDSTTHFIVAQPQMPKITPPGQKGAESDRRRLSSPTSGWELTSAPQLVRETVQSPVTPEAQESERPMGGQLTAREIQVLRLVAEGLTSKQIGHQLFVSPRTVDHHLSMIFNKLAVDSRAHAVAISVRQGIL
jgi:DNA-binding CsgD family transcriptional regulator